MIAIGPNFIGNARQQNDNLTAVSDALRLSECHLKLAADVSKAGVDRADFPQAQIQFMVSHFSDPAYIDSTLAGDKAVALIADAVASGDLKVRRVHDGREVELTPIRLDRDNIRLGIFKTNHRPEPDMEGAWLWVKERDWLQWIARDGGRQQPPTLTAPLPSDDEIAAKMIELIDGGMRRDGAAKAIKDIPGFEAVGNELARRVVAGRLARGRPKKTRHLN